MAKSRTTAGSSRARPRGRPPGSTSDATRTRILQAARACFARTGYVATTNKDIAAHAGITAAAIYQYFDSKVALFAAVAREAQDELVARFDEASASETTARAKLRAMILSMSDLHDQDPSLAKFLSALPVDLQRDPDVASVMADGSSEVVALFAAIVDEGVAAKEIDASEAPRLVAMLIACTMGLSLYAAAVDGDSLRDAVGAFVAMMDGSLFRAKGTRRRG